MKLVELFKCSRPVLFENDYEGYEYSVGGTAFVVKFKNHYYVLTAKHVIINLSKFSPDQFRVQYRPDSRDFLPISNLYKPSVTDTEDTDQFDLAVFQIDDSTLQAELFGEHRPYNLLEMDKFTIYNPNSKFVYRGFPIETRNIDWVEKNMHQAALLGEAEYLGPTGYACTHKLRLLNLQSLNSIDGLSGSPVFQINHDDDRFSRESFAGILIRGSRGCDEAHFLEHRRVIDVLKEIDERHSTTFV